MYENELNNDSSSWAYDVLETDQLSSSKLQFKQRSMNRKLSILLWGLRLYAIVMLLLVIVQVVNSFDQ